MRNPFTPSDNYYAYNQPRSPLKKILIVAGVVLVIAGAVAFITLLISKQIDSAEEDAQINALVDPAEEQEELYPELAKAVESMAQKNYASNTDETAFYNLTENYFPLSLESSTAEAALVYSVAFSALNNSYVSPVALEKTPVAEAALNYGITITEIAGANANILHYYLDNGAVVLIEGEGDAPFSETGKAVLVYAAAPLLGLFRYYAVGEACDGCAIPTTISKTTLFAALKSDAKFYVIKRGTK